jgi:transposase
MLATRSNQRGLFEADHLYLDYVGRDTFYGFLASQRGKLFRDENFAELYCSDNGRPSVPPSILAMSLVLQTYDGVSDDEAKQRADFDLRWKVALGIEINDRPFAKSTLQLFRAQLVLHDRARELFIRSIEMAKSQGFLKRRKKLHIAVDTMAIFGRGAVKDTYNLLADGITQLIRTLAKLTGTSPQAWAEQHDLARYFQPSIKGSEQVDWDDEQSRRKFLAGIVDDADRLLERAREIRSSFDPESEQAKRIEDAAGLLLAATVANLTLVAASVSRSTSYFAYIFASLTRPSADTAASRPFVALMIEFQSSIAIPSFKEHRRAA